KPLEVCLREARDLVADGCHELILIAQDTTNYGTDLYGHRALPMLLGQLAQVEPLRWLRVLYSHPAHFDAAAIEAFAATPKLCPYVDLPIQHASDRLLEQMGRGATRAAMADLIGRLRARIPNLTLRTTVLLGYPGETESDFAELLDFIEETEFDRLGAFAYSEEDGTRAATEEPVVPPDVRAARRDEVMRRQQAIAFRKAKARVGTRIEVVLDRRLDARTFTGRSAAEAPDVDPLIRVRGRHLRPGQFIEVEIANAVGYDLEARVGGQPPRRKEAHGPRA
ncbi:MAG: radical SAM protein, partial [Planctomycetes bacterium]|nr:radical SAM protein [Planctomycetota bacterium]